MKRINLLPERIKQARMRRRERVTLGLLLGAALLVGVTWSGFAITHLSRLDSRIVDADRQLAPLREVSGETQRLQAQRRQLEARLALVRELREPLPPATILALLSQVAPEDVVLSDLTMQFPEPSLPTDQKQKKDAEVPMPIVHVTIEGLARGDAAVAGMVSRLAEQPVFRNVRLTDSREAAVRDRPAHRFRITMQLPLMRPVTTADAGGGVR